MELWLQGLLRWLLPKLKKCLAVPRNFFCKSYWRMSGLTLLCQECSQSSSFFATYTNSPGPSKAYVTKVLVDHRWSRSFQSRLQWSSASKIMFTKENSRADKQNLLGLRTWANPGFFAKHLGMWHLFLSVRSNQLKTMKGLIHKQQAPQIVS